MFKINNKNTRTTSLRRSGVNCEHILRLRSGVFIVNFEHVIASWDSTILFASILSNSAMKRLEQLSWIFPANIYMFKSTTETLEKGVKYV